MATFTIEQSEGTRWVKATLEGEAIRAERGALSHLTGDVVMDMPPPRLRDLVVSAVSDESPFRPRFSGTGEVYLESTMGGYHVLDVAPGETWVFSNGAYWASEDGIRLSIARERVMTAFWAGEGFFWYNTSAEGRGKVVLLAEGPVEERLLDGGRLVATAGSIVLGRTADVRMSIRRPTRSRLAYYVSGEPYARVYEGTGKVLLCTTPYWRLRVRSESHRDPALLS